MGYVTLVLNMIWISGPISEKYVVDSMTDRESPKTNFNNKLC